MFAGMRGQAQARQPQARARQIQRRGLQRILAQQGLVAGQRGFQILDHQRHTGHAADAVGMLAHRAWLHAQRARRDVAAQKRQIGRRGPGGLPLEQFAIGPGPPAIERAFERQPASCSALDHGLDIAGVQREIDQAFAMRLQRLPPTVVGQSLAMPGNQLQVGAVLEHHQGVVRGPARVAAALDDLKAQRGVVGNGARQIGNGNHQMVEG